MSPYTTLTKKGSPNRGLKNCQFLPKKTTKTGRTKRFPILESQPVLTKFDNFDKKKTDSLGCGFCYAIDLCPGPNTVVKL
jgi:hypothetical protein